MNRSKSCFWTVPNLLSLMRIGLVPLFLWCFFSGLPDARWWAMGIFLLAGLTDLLDGWIARRFHQTSVAGRVLDPLADKLMMVSALGSLAAVDVIPLWLVLLYAAKELTQGVCGLLLMGRIKDMPPSNLLGKAGTCLFYVTVLWLALFPIDANVKTALLALSYATIGAAFLSYLMRAVRQGWIKHPRSEE